MYMIPQFLEKEAKKILKLKLEKIITNITDEFIDNLFVVDPNYKYQDIMINLDSKVRNAVIDILKETIQIFDDLYYKCDERKKYFNKCSICHRSIITIFGELEFNRIYYYDKKDRTKHFYFIDNLFKLPSYDRYDTLVKGLSINNAISTNQKKGAEITNNMLNSISSTINSNKKYNISRQDIYNWINKWNLPEIEYFPIIDDSNTLYIMVDEKYIHEQIKAVIDKENNITRAENTTSYDIKNDILQFIKMLNSNYSERLLMLPPPKEKKKNYIMSKAFITFTKIKRKKGRTTLINKTTFLTAGLNPWEEFIDFISKYTIFLNIKLLKF